MSSKVFRPMLSATVEDTALLSYPLLASVKIDGVRCIIRDGVAMSRSMKPIPNASVQAWAYTHAKPLADLDGELVVGAVNDPNVMQHTTSGVMSRSGDPDFTFFVFDHVHEGTYSYRMHGIADRASDAPRCIVLPQSMVSNETELLEFEAWALASGYEGVMLRGVMAPYKQGRSTMREHGLMKLKRFVDSEAQIVEVIELERNANELTQDELGYAKRSTAQDGRVPAGTMGALSVIDIHTHVPFSIGTGFDAETRNYFWSNRNNVVGRVVKYKSFPVGVKEAPRFPVYLGFRHPDDM